MQLNVVNTTYQIKYLSKKKRIIVIKLRNACLVPLQSAFNFHYCVHSINTLLMVLDLHCFCFHSHLLKWHQVLTLKYQQAFQGQWTRAKNPIQLNVSDTFQSNLFHPNADDFYQMPAIK